jgi:dCTP deaminase
MMLSDGSIQDLVRGGIIGINPPLAPEAYQPASVDLRLGRSFILFGPNGPGEPVEIDNPKIGIFGLAAGACVLGCTLEEIHVPDNLVARVEGKSTWGRRFLQIHSTAGFIDPGFRGQITLELHNLSPGPLFLPLEQPIAQISFQLLDAPARRPYGSSGLGSRYQGQTGATAARDQPC